MQKRILVWKSERKRPLERTRQRGSIILKWILKKYYIKCGPGSINAGGGQ
jgi:hypothetical protein